VIRVEQKEPRRDRYGRPEIDGEFYTRASSMSSAVEDKYNIQQWSMRQVGIGVARTKHLVAGFASADPKNSRTLNELVEKALDASGATASREIGTAIHAATERFDYGESLDGVPDHIVGDVEAYGDAMSKAGFVPQAAEIFVVNDELKVAGSTDRIALGAGGGMGIVDIKTSSSPDSAKWAGLSWAIQIAIYANSTPYCSERGRLSWYDIGLEPPNKLFGVVAHIMQGSGKCRLYKVDLQRGWELAQLASTVRAARKTKGLVEAL
jgi:hypothetical protein